jgi:preprotein translocase subunit SecG
MNGFLLTVNIILGVMLIGVVLLQPGTKGGGLGAAFGGGGANSAFGARGAAPILAKLTYWLAGAFVITCIVIEALIVKQNRSVLDRGASLRTPAKSAPAPAVPPVPAAPAPVPAQK